MPQKPSVALFLVLGCLAILGFGVALYSHDAREESADSSNLAPSKALAPYLTGPMRKIIPFEKREPLYEYPIHLADGRIVPLNSFKDKAMLINLWASWCAPCRSEMPELANLEREVGSEHFTVLALNQDFGGIEQAAEVLQEWDVQGLDIYADPTLRTSQELALGRLPMSLLVDRKGRVIGKYLGPLKWDAPEGIALFTALRDGKI